MLIVGLGNPDKKYFNTYHNVGFAVMDKLADKLSLNIKDKECKALTATKYVNGEKVVFAKPMTYMNLSGEAVRELKGKYKLADEDILIIYDDIDLAVGATRVRKTGSGGTHNGMRNIVANLGEKIPRLRIGIGRPAPPMELVDYVLSDIRGENRLKLDETIEHVAECLIKFVKDFDIEALSANLAK